MHACVACFSEMVEVNKLCAHIGCRQASTLGDCYPTPQRPMKHWLTNGSNLRTEPPRLRGAGGVRGGGGGLKTKWHHPPVGDYMHEKVMCKSLTCITRWGEVCVGCRWLSYAHHHRSMITPLPLQCLPPRTEH